MLVKIHPTLTFTTSSLNSSHNLSLPQNVNHASGVTTALTGDNIFLLILTMFLICGCIVLCFASCSKSFQAWIMSCCGGRARRDNGFNRSNNHNNRGNGFNGLPQQPSQPSQQSRSSWRGSICWPFWQGVSAPDAESSRAESQLVLEGLVEVYGVNNQNNNECLDRPLPLLPNASPSLRTATPVRSLQPNVISIGPRTPPRFPQFRSITPRSTPSPSNSRHSQQSITASLDGVDE
ncbi:hypothetical protein SEUCBS140593_003993 [Sporothrix eucalyptigena]|uniref:Uncharacterized protein n=1 Tax=Sporothrix eucalyptigena TaxID=1812306 RepID=A0ABP0BJD8_9PEZI